MSQGSKRELIKAIRPRYLKANKKGKAQILNEFIATTGYHRKSAIRVLNREPKPKGLQKPGRQKIHSGEVVEVLAQIWEICGRICSKRQQPFLPEMATVLERHHKLSFSPEIKALLLSRSRNTLTATDLATGWTECLDSRPYQKNDQAHVEQKNWSVVRHTVGYDRLETPEELDLLRSIYADLRLYSNFFQPVSGKTARPYRRQGG